MITPTAADAAHSLHTSSGRSRWGRDLRPPVGRMHLRRSARTAHNTGPPPTCLRCGQPVGQQRLLRQLRARPCRRAARVDGDAGAAVTPAAAHVQQEASPALHRMRAKSGTAAPFLGHESSDCGRQRRDALPVTSMQVHTRQNSCSSSQRRPQLLSAARCSQRPLGHTAAGRHLATLIGVRSDAAGAKRRCLTEGCVPTVRPVRRAV